MFEESFLSRRDPEGYFVIILKRRVYSDISKIPNLIVEDYGECIIVKTKSRRIAHSILRRFSGDICVEEL